MHILYMTSHACKKDNFFETSQYIASVCLVNWSGKAHSHMSAACSFVLQSLLSDKPLICASFTHSASALHVCDSKRLHVYNLCI